MKHGVIDVATFLRENWDEEKLPVLFVKLPTRDDRPQRWFIADKRATHDGKGNMLEPTWVCVHGGTTSPRSLLQNLGWVASRERNKDQPWVGVWVIEADTTSQAAMYLRMRGEHIKHQINTKRHYALDSERMEFIEMPQHPDYEPSYGDTMLDDGFLAPDIRALQRTIDRAQQRIDFLASLPEEPDVDEDGVAVIFFQKTFNGAGRKYDYCAIRARNGRWNTTGPRSPKDYSWDQLIRWIYDGSPNTTILVATEWTAL